MRRRKEVREVRRKAVRRILSMEIGITKNGGRVMLEKQRTRIFTSLGMGMGVTWGPQGAATRSIKGRWFVGMTSEQQFWWGHTNKDIPKVTMTSKEGTSPTTRPSGSRAAGTGTPPWRGLRGG